MKLCTKIVSRCSKVYCQLNTIDVHVRVVSFNSAAGIELRRETERMQHEKEKGRSDENSLNNLRCYETNAKKDCRNHLCYSNGRNGCRGLGSKVGSGRRWHIGWNGKCRVADK